MSTFQITVTVECETLEQADTVAAERLNYDEDYGFSYELGGYKVKRISGPHRNPLLEHYRAHRAEPGMLDLYFQYTGEQAEADPVLTQIVFSVTATPRQIRQANRVIRRLEAAKR